jgi:hypothetical protein
MSVTTISPRLTIVALNFLFFCDATLFDGSLTLLVSASSVVASGS